MNGIVFLGHSVPKGTDYGGVTAADTFVRKIGVAAGYAVSDIINAGKSSDTTTGMLGRFAADVLAHSPSVLVFAGCVVNDWATGIPVTTTKANLLNMADQAKALGIRCVMFTDTMNRGTSAEFTSYYPYVEATKEVAALKGMPLVDTYARLAQQALVGDHASLYVDSLHYSIAGHTFIANFAAKPYHAGFFVADPVVVPDPGPDPTPDPSEPSALLLAVTDYVLATGNATLTAGVLAAKEAAQTA